MQLVRSVVAKVSNNLQYCRSIRNHQSRELCTSLRNNDGNSRKERGVSVLRELFRKSAGVAIAYWPYAVASTSVGWYAYSYATTDRDREENLKARLEKIEKRWDKIEKRSEEIEKRSEEKEKQTLKVIDTLEEKMRTNSETNRKLIMDLITKQEEKLVLDQSLSAIPQKSRS